MKAGDLVRCPPVNSKWGAERELCVFMGYEGSKIHSYVWVRGKKLLFLTRELEKVTRC